MSTILTMPIRRPLATNREAGLGCAQAAMIAVPASIAFWIALFWAAERMLG